MKRVTQVGENAFLINGQRICFVAGDYTPLPDENDPNYETVITEFETLAGVIIEEAENSGVPLETLKLEKIEIAKQEQEKQMGLGFTVGNNIASSDPSQIALMDHYAIRLAFGQSYPTQGLRFILIDGTEVTVNQTQFQNGFMAWGQRVKSLREHYADLVKSISSATIDTQAKLDAIDVSAGWPAL